MPEFTKGFLATVHLAILKGTGVKQIRIEYAGGGDSGQTERVVALGANDEELPIPEPLSAEIDQWAWAEAIPNTGWWNNEGGYGTVTIDLDTMQAEVEHTDRGEGESQHTDLIDRLAKMPKTVRDYCVALRALGFEAVTFSGYCSSEDDADAMNWNGAMSRPATEEYKKQYPGYNVEYEWFNRFAPRKVQVGRRTIEIRDPTNAFAEWVEPAIEALDVGTAGAQVEVGIELGRKIIVTDASHSTSWYREEQQYDTVNLQ
jgi:hypothetical protein